MLSVAASGSVEIEKLTIPAKGTYSFADYSHAGSVIEIDKQTNTQILHEFLK